MKSAGCRAGNARVSARGGHAVGAAQRPAPGVGTAPGPWRGHVDPGVTWGAAAAAARRGRDRGEHDTDHRQDRETDANRAEDEAASARPYSFPGPGGSRGGPTWRA